MQGQDQTGNFAKIGLKKSRKQLLLPPPRTVEMIYCHGLNGNLEKKKKNKKKKTKYTMQDTKWCLSV